MAASLAIQITIRSRTATLASATDSRTTYTGAATRDDDGSSTIEVNLTRSVPTLDFEGVTYDAVNLQGRMVCGDE